MIRLVLIDDHDIVRRGLKDLFGTTEDIQVVGETNDGEGALAVVEESQPDVVLMDISMPNKNGVDATKEVVQQFPDVAVIMLTSFGDQESISGALESGAIGYLLKHAGPDDIISAVRVAKNGGAPLDPVAARALLLRTRNTPKSAPSSAIAQAGTGRRRLEEHLSDREVEVLDAVRRGLSNKQVARELGIAERTVKAHLTSIFQALQVTDRTQAALWAQEFLPNLPR